MGIGEFEIQETRDTSSEIILLPLHETLCVLKKKRTCKILDFFNKNTRDTQYMFRKLAAC